VTPFSVAATIVPVVVKMVCAMQSMISIPETIVFAYEKIFLSAGTIFLVNQKMVSGFPTTVFISQTKVSDTGTKVEDTKKMFCVSATIFSVSLTMY
jgi:hypothetical protein